MTAADAAWLLQPAYRRLWDACRLAVERNGGVAGAARLTGLTAEEAAEIDALIRPLRRPSAPPLRVGGQVSIDLRRFASSLEPISLQEVLVAHDGPLRDLPAARARHRARLAAMWEAAMAHRAAEHPRVREWLTAARANGAVSRIVKDVDERQRLLLACLDVVASLPREGVELSRLASETTGDTHALDYRTPLGRLCAAAVAARFDGQRPATAAQWRVMWARAGVACDALSATVLTLGLRPAGSGPVATATRTMADAGQPVLITLHALLSEWPVFAPQTVYVCENPAVVSYAAARLGGRGAALVCTGGWPSTAASRLLRRLTECECRLRVQGDFDWEGARIHRHVRHAHHAANWQYTADTYLAVSTGRADATLLSQDELTDDSSMSQAMRRTGIAVYEEDLVERLCEDLYQDEGVRC